MPRPSDNDPNADIDQQERDKQYDTNADKDEDEVESGIGHPMFPSHARQGSLTGNSIPVNTPLSTSGIMTIVKRICERAGRTNPSLRTLAPHDLRRSFAGMAQAGGSDINLIRHAMGHASISTTEQYLQDIQSMSLGSTAPDHIRVNTKRRKKVTTTAI